MNTDEIRERLRRLGFRAIENEPMARHTTFGIGGSADLFIVAQTRDRVKRLVRFALRNDLPFFVLGSGSNLLVSDAGIRGLVVHNCARTTTILAPDADTFNVDFDCDSGVPLSRLARHTAATGYGGLEWAAGIPGTVGGAVFTNAGAFGGCTADVVTSVEVITEKGSLRRLSAAKLDFGYRSSVFAAKARAGQRWSIVGVQLGLYCSLYPLRKRVAAMTAQRRATQPRGRTAGSVFKNPPGYAAGWLIEQAGLKGVGIGDAQIATVHANFIVNRGTATAADVLALMELAQTRVRQQFGIELEPEIELVGEGM